MFGRIREELGGISRGVDALTVALEAAIVVWKEIAETQGLRERVDALEGPTRTALAQVEGMLANSVSLKDAARNAEERSRGMMKRAETLLKELAESDEAYLDEPPVGNIEQLRRKYGEGGDEPGVSLVLSEVEGLARAKFEGR